MYIIGTIILHSNKVNMLSGIDVSSNNHPNGAPIFWGSVADAGKQLAIIKVSEFDYVNPFAEADYKDAEEAGISCFGLLDFARFDLGSGAHQADIFLTGVGSIGGVRPGTRYVLDVEEHAGSGPQIDPHADLAAGCLDWASRVWPVQERQDTKLRPILYSRRQYLLDHSLAIANPTPPYDLNAVFDLWLVGDGDPRPPPGWSKVWIWQAYGTCDGIQGSVDLDHFDGIAYDWLSRSWGYQTSPLNVSDTPDVDPGWDNSRILRHVSNNLRSLHADVSIVVARGGLIG